MASIQDRFDDAMHHFSMAEYDAAIDELRAILEEDPGHFDAQLAIGMAYCRKGDLEQAIAEGHKAEALRPREQLVHTNLSLFYVKAGDKQKAEHHGLQARIASWADDSASAPASDSELNLAKPPPAPVKFTGRLPDMPWKNNSSPADAPKPPDAGETKT